MGDTVNAMRDYQAAISLDPCYSLAYYNAANLYFKHRQFKQVNNVFICDCHFFYKHDKVRVIAS